MKLLKVPTSLGVSCTLTMMCAAGCLSAEVENPCNSSPTFERFSEEAAKLAAASYVPEEVQPCPPLDRPPDGDKSAEGVVFEEYAEIISGTSGNFLDQSSWWAKALPRGELHVQTLQIDDAACRPLSYEQFSYDYAAATPPIVPTPQCGHSLSGVAMGHQFFQSSPQIFELEATAYARLVGLQVNPVLGTSLRFATENAAYEGEQFPALTRVAIASPDEHALGFAARIRATSFEGAMEGKLTAAAATTLRIRLRVFPRAGADPTIRLGVLAMSSMFWKGADDTPEVTDDQAHDTDHLYVRMQDGSEQLIPLINPPPELQYEADPWQRTTFDGPLESIGLEQKERDPTRFLRYRSAHYSERPSVTASEITSNVPLTAELSVSYANSEYFDNLVLNLVAHPDGSGAPIEVSYLLTASSI
ncbi:MAG TPA: glucan biosynthesis protein [Polyangiaceae bacterium]|nr:glucan biosynthesis protein [Polyangiaceae bacterium]